MKYVLLIFQGPTPTIPGTDRWKALPKAEQGAIYADYAELDRTPGISLGPPLGFPDMARTVRVRNGETAVGNGTYLSEGVAGYAVLEAASMDPTLPQRSRRLPGRANSASASAAA